MVFVTQWILIGLENFLDVIEICGENVTKKLKLNFWTTLRKWKFCLRCKIPWFHVKLKGRFYITVKFEIRFWHCILQLGHESVIHFVVSLYRWHGSPSRSFYFQGILCQFYKRSLKFDELSVPRRIYLIAQLNLLSFTLFHATVPFLYPLKKPKELRFLTYLGGKDWPEMGEPKL